MFVLFSTINLDAQLTEVKQLSALELLKLTKGMVVGETQRNPPGVGWRGLLWVCFFGWMVATQTFFSFSPRKLGKMNPIWLIFLYIFQMGWKPPTSCFLSDSEVVGRLGGVSWGKTKRHKGRGVEECNMMTWHVWVISWFGMLQWRNG